MAIQFQNNYSGFRLRRAPALRKWLAGVIASEKKNCGRISYSFVSDEELLKINKEFLKHNTYTDIVTFDYSEGKILHGEIFISIDRVGDNTFKLKGNFEEELWRVMVHGILHLCGYKDKTAADKKMMRAKEGRALRLLDREK